MSHKMTDPLTVHPKAGTCKGQFSLTGHKVICPLLAFLPFLFVISEKFLSLQSIFCLWTSIMQSWIFSTCSPRKASAKQPAGFAAWLSGGGWQTGNLGSLPSSLPSKSRLGTPLPIPAISSVPLFNNFLSHLAAIMLLFLKHYFCT